MKLPLSKIADFISAPGDFPREELALGYSIDSRTVNPSELFFAVKGERISRAVNERSAGGVRAS